MYEWDSVELALDTPYNPAFPWLQPARTRGNLLSLERVWLAADTPQAPWLPMPEHLRLGWQAGLPYWVDLDASELEAVWQYAHGIIHLIEEAGTRLELNIAHWGYAGPGRKHPAYTPLYVPLFLAPRYPRYEHSHSGGVLLAEHPPVVVQKPRGKHDLPNLIVRALVEEGIAAWVGCSARLHGYCPGNCPLVRH